MESQWHNHNGMAIPRAELLDLEFHCNSEFQIAVEEPNKLGLAFEMDRSLELESPWIEVYALNVDREKLFFEPGKTFTSAALVLKINRYIA